MELTNTHQRPRIVDALPSTQGKYRIYVMNDLDEILEEIQTPMSAAEAWRFAKKRGLRVEFPNGHT